MVKKLVKSLVGLMGVFLGLPFGKQLVVFIISLMPILELRGGLIAAALLGLKPLESYIITIIGGYVLKKYLSLNYLLENPNQMCLYN